MTQQDTNKNLISINSICACIGFSGDNCLDFLNNLLISDLTTLSSNNCHYSALCNPKGRIISSLWVCIENINRIKIICPANMLETLISFFTMRKFRLKIDINESDNNITINNNTIQILNTTDKTTDSATQERFYEYIFNNNLAWIDTNNSEKFIPQHVNMDQHDNIMSFSKGCYPGQEIIARLKFLGKIKKRMNLVEAENNIDLIEQINIKNQVSPIINISENQFSVQVIKNVI